MNEEDTKSRSSTSSVLSIVKKLAINTKASEFDKFFKLVTQQFSVEEGYEEVGHALSTGTQLVHPPFDIHEFNESYPVAHNPEIKTLYGYNENQWSEFRLSTLKEVQKEWRKEWKKSQDAWKRAYHNIVLCFDDDFITAMKGSGEFDDAERMKCPLSIMRLAHRQAYKQGSVILDDHMNAVVMGRTLFRKLQYSATNYEFLENCKANHGVCKAYGFDWLAPYTSMRTAIKNCIAGEITLDDLDAIADQDAEKNLARLLMANCAYAELRTDLAKNAVNGNENAYPNTVQDAIQRLTVASIHEKERKSRRFKKEKGEVSPLRSPLQKKPVNAQHFLSQPQTKKEIPNNWILLDTISLGNFFKSKELIEELEKDKRGGTTVICNAGDVKVDTKGKFLMDRALTIWYDKRLIANVLSFSQVRRTCDVEMIGDKFAITWKDGTKWEFKQSSEFGFFYSDTDWSKNSHCDKHVLLASTVKDKKSKFTPRDVSKANKSRKLEAILSFPSTRQYKWAVESNVILDCPVRSHDIK